MPDFQVDHGPKRLHQVVYQTHGIGVVAVVQANAGVQARRNDRKRAANPS
jgi:hypothetical protein